MTDLKENRKVPIYENEPEIDRNFVTVLVLDLNEFTEYRKEHNILFESDLTYKEAVKLARGEYSLFDMVRLMNTSADFQTFDPNTHCYIPVDHKRKVVIAGGFDPIN